MSDGADQIFAADTWPKLTARIAERACFDGSEHRSVEEAERLGLDIYSETSSTKALLVLAFRRNLISGINNAVAVTINALPIKAIRPRESGVAK